MGTEISWVRISITLRILVNKGDLSIIETIADWVCVSGRYFLFIGRTDANFLDHLAPLEVREEGKQVNLVC